jgi:hypothetical protein
MTENATSPRQSILWDEYRSHRGDLGAAFERAKSASRLILPFAVAEILAALGANVALPAQVTSIPTYPYLVLAVSLFGILALGFLALSESLNLLYLCARLAELESRLKVPIDEGYYLRDLVEHAQRKGTFGARVACAVVGTRLPHVWVYAAAGIIAWTTFATLAVGLVNSYAHGLGNQGYFYAAIGTILTVVLLLIASRLFVLSFPPTLTRMFREEEWLKKFEHARFPLPGESSQ